MYVRLVDILKYLKSSAACTHLTRPPGVRGGAADEFSILVFRSLVSAVTPVVVVDVVGGGGLVVVVVVVVVVTTTVRVLEVGGAVLAARRAEQGVSLHTRRSRLPPRQGAPPPTAGVATPRVLTWKQYVIIQN
jgi:hypothetical protein